MPAECRSTRPRGHPPPPTAHAKARCLASARTERRLLEGLPHEAPQVPRSDPQGPEPRPRAAPSSRPGASGGCEQNKFAHSLRGPAASHLVRSFRGRSPTQSGLRAPEPQQSREDCGARPEAGGRSASPAWGRTVAGLVRGGSSHVMREAGDAGSRGSAAGAGFWTTPAEQEPQGISCREGPREKRHEGGDGWSFRCCEVELVGGRLRLVLRGPRRGRNRIGGRKLQGGVLGSI